MKRVSSSVDFDYAKSSKTSEPVKTKAKQIISRCRARQAALSAVADHVLSGIPK